MKIKSILPYLMLLLALLLILSRLQPVNGEVGHDYTHYFARLMMGADHFWKNGWSTPHFTPYLCGGMPFYADPQAIYHSVQQFLAFYLAPLFATHLTFLIFYLLGYWGMFTLTSRIFQCDRGVSHFASLIFLLNGFCFVHLVVGHITHYQFLLAPWILYAVMEKTHHSFQRILRASALLTLCVSYTVYSGGLHVALVFAGMLFVAAPFVLAEKIKEREQLDLLKVGGVTLLLLVAVLSGKLMAAIRFSPVFHHAEVDTAALPIWTMVLRYFWFNPENVPPYVMFGKWAFGIWEYVAFVSRLTIPALLIAPFLFVRSRSSRIVFLMTLVCITLLIALATGHLWNSHLPFFKSYHNPIKLLSGLTPLMIVLLAVVLNRLTKKVAPFFHSDFLKTMIYGLTSLIVISEYLINTAPIHSHPGARGVRYEERAFLALKDRGGLPPVEKVMPYTNADLPAAMRGGTCLGCYEPLFGYRHESFGSRLTVGYANEVKQAHFNLHHPGCFLYGKELNCNPWDAISTQEAGAFEAFRSGKGVAEWVPQWQRVLDWSNTFFFLVCFILAIDIPYGSYFSWLEPKSILREQVSP